MKNIQAVLMGAALSWQVVAGAAGAGEDFQKPYSPPCVERENVFEFTERPVVKFYVTTNMRSPLP
jgi:hypothetical protein